MPYQLQEVDSLIKELSKNMMVLHTCTHFKITYTWVKVQNIQTPELLIFKF